MTLNRREFAAMMAGALGGITVPFIFRSDGTVAEPTQSSAPLVRGDTYFDWRRVGARVQVAMLGGGNALLYMGSSEALLSDTKGFGLGRTLAREAEGLDVPVTQVVHTHHHSDHSGGAEAFPEAVRVAHENAAPRIRDTAAANLERAEASLAALRGRLAASEAPEEMAEDLDAMGRALENLTPAHFLPTATFGEAHEMHVDGRPVLLRWVSRGHTDGDAFVYLPEENVLHCGDLLFHRSHPYVDTTAGATPTGWIRCVDAMLDLCDSDTVVVPGHGELTDRAGLAAQREYFVQLQSLVERALSEGRTRSEAVAMETAELGALGGGEQRLRTNLGIVYDETTS